ncbi:MAG: hypothetical protein AAFU79_02030 [Myxococcota bacterium]
MTDTDDLKAGQARLEERLNRLLELGGETRGDVRALRSDLTERVSGLEAKDAANDVRHEAVENRLQGIEDGQKRILERFDGVDARETKIDRRVVLALAGIIATLLGGGGLAAAGFGPPQTPAAKVDEP